MNDWGNVPVSKTEAKRALTAGAFTETHKHCDTCTCDVPPDRQIIHSRLGGIGADHNLNQALDLVEQAERIAWTTSLLRHDLAVCVGTRIYCYDIPRPERVGEET